MRIAERQPGYDRGMPRRLRAFTLVLPLVVAGSLLGHAGGYALAEPDRARRAAALGEAGHGYVAEVWLALIAILSVALGVELALGVARGPVRRTVAPWPFALLAPSGFLVQEHVERLAHGADATHALTERSVLIGLALQAPFALAAWALARIALSGSAAMGAAVQRSTFAPLPVCGLLHVAVEAPRIPSAGAVAGNTRGRAPPACIRPV